jgi:phosphoribosylglycinamide formyltransferase-1
MQFYDSIRVDQHSIFGMNNFKLLILASGGGTNAENIIQQFVAEPKIDICAIGSNKSDAYVLKRAKNLSVPSFVFMKSAFESLAFKEVISQYEPTHIILAGFLLKVPKWMIEAYPDRIINIHPALLPKYGGKGMYGSHVHAAVKKNKEELTGITIHLVNEHYDEGAILFQASCKLEPSDSEEDIAKKVHQLEHTYFPKVIKDYLLG